MAKKPKYQVRTIYNKNDVRVVEYTHKNGSKTLRGFYQGRSDNPKEVLNHISRYEAEISRTIQEERGLEPNETLTDHLRRTNNPKYVDNLGGNNQGIILGAYVHAKDQIYLLRNIPSQLVDAINRVRPSQLEQMLEDDYSHSKRVSASDIAKFRDTHEAAHKRRAYTGESQNEQEVDLEAAIATNSYPLIRFPQVLRAMNDPKIRETIENKPGFEYVKNAA